MDEQHATGLKKFFLPTFLYFSYMLALWMILAFIPLYLDSLGFVHLQIGSLISLFFFSPLLVAFPFGVFSDKLSPKLLTIIGLTLLCLFSFLVRFPIKFSSFLLLFILGGVGSSIFRVSCSSLYYKSLGETQKGKKLGFFYSVGHLGYALGPMIGGSLAVIWGMKFLFLVVSLLILPFLLLSHFLKDVEPIPFEIGQYKRDLSRKGVLVLVVLTFLISFHFGVERACLSLFLKHDIGVSENLIGTVFFTVGIILALVIFLTGSLSDVKGSPKYYLLLGLAISGTFNLAMLWVDSFLSVLMVRILHVLGDSVFLITQRIAISNLFVSSRVGGSLGLMNMVMISGVFIGAILSGMIPGYTLPFGVAGLLALSGVIIILAANPDFSHLPSLEASWEET